MCAVAKCYGDVLTVCIGSDNNGFLTSRQYQLLTRYKANSALCLVNLCLNVLLSAALDVGFTLFCGCHLTKRRYAGISGRVYLLAFSSGRVIYYDNVVTRSLVNNRAVGHHLHIAVNDIHLLVVTLAVFLFEDGRAQRAVSMLHLLGLLSLLGYHVGCILVDALHNTVPCFLCFRIVWVGKFYGDVLTLLRVGFVSSVESCANRVAMLTIVNAE